MTQEELISKYKPSLPNGLSRWVTVSVLLICALPAVLWFISGDSGPNYITFMLLSFSPLWFAFCLAVIMFSRKAVSVTNEKRMLSNKADLHTYLRHISISKLSNITYHIAPSGQITVTTEYGPCYPDRIEFVASDHAFLTGKVIAGLSAIHIEDSVYNAVLYLPEAEIKRIN